MGHGGAAFFGHGAAGGVLEVGQQVDKAGLVRAAADFGTQVTGVNAVVITVHTHHRGLHWGEGLQRTQIGGRLDQDAATRVDQNFRHQVEALLAAGGDQHLVGADFHALFEQVVGHPFAQGGIAFAGSVLQGDFAVIPQHAFAGLAHGVDRKGQG